MYSPPVVAVRVCVYCAVTGSSNTVSVPSVTVVESLVQVTVVAGPPVEIQARVSKVRLNVAPLAISTSPVVTRQRTKLHEDNWAKLHGTTQYIVHRSMLVGKLVWNVGFLAMDAR